MIAKAGLKKPRSFEKLKSELHIHQQMNNEHVCTFRRYFEDAQNIYMMLDICQNQSLSDLIKRRKRLHLQEARFYLHQLIQGVKYIHSKRVIHRDLKVGNLFLTEKMKLKIGDFGLAAQLNDLSERKKSVCGTPNYLAPELLQQEAYGVKGYSFEVDLWSIGVICFIMLVGKAPFESPDVKQTYNKIKLGMYSIPPELQIHPIAKRFIRECLTPDFQKRLTLDEMLQHDLFMLSQVPKSLPVSTLAAPLQESYAMQFALPNGENFVSHTTRERTQTKQDLNEQGDL